MRYTTSEAVDALAYHVPGCGQRHRDCRCYYEAPDMSPFAVAMREGDRAIAAMVMDTAKPYTPWHDLTDLVTVDAIVYIAVQIRPGLNITRPERRIRCYSSAALYRSLILTTNNKETVQ
jgi:hypothetical protein